jgi:hypothetical protein
VDSNPRKTLTELMKEVGLALSALGNRADNESQMGVDYVDMCECLLLKHKELIASRPRAQPFRKAHFASASLALIRSRSMPRLYLSLRTGRSWSRF